MVKQLNKDPTDTHQKQIQQTFQRYNVLVDKQSHKYLTNVKPTAQKLNVHIKTHKDDEPLGPVIKKYIGSIVQDG